MRIQILLFLLIVATSYVQAQSPHFCGTQMGRSKWLKMYQQQLERFDKGNEKVLYVPMTIHFLGSDAGTGHFSMVTFLDAMCTLNTDFEVAGLHFFVEDTINYIDNTAWNDHDDILTGVEMMFANNIENTLNIYFVSNPAGACGYNLPYAGIANRKSCSNAEDHTWAHEVGHALSLPHPFIGWEGGVSYDNSVEHNYNDPAPREVYYDYTLFQQELFTDTLIIDTALVELVDGSNCLEAADGFCDTAPDYLSLRWNCNNNGESPTTQTDPDGVTFRSDASLIMGYALDACQARFTPDQIAAMRAFLLDQRSNWLYDQTPAPILAQTPIEPISPFSEELALPENTYFEWTPVENATHYLLQVSPFPRFNVLQVNTVVAGNNFTADQLNPERNYYWRVRPFNAYNTCSEFSETFTFRTSDLTSTSGYGTDLGIEVYPNPAAAQSSITIEAPSAVQDLNLTLLDTKGRIILTQNMPFQSTNYTLQLESVPSGIYFLKIQSKQGVQIERLLVN